MDSDVVSMASRAKQAPVELAEIADEVHPPLHRWCIGFIGLNAAFVAIFATLAPKALDEAFTWASLPPLHARFVGALYLWGAIVVFWSVFAPRRLAWWPIVVAAAIFTTSMGVLTALNRAAFTWSLVPVKVWVIAYTLFPLTTLAMAWAYRPSGPITTDLPRAAIRGLQVWAAWFAVVGVGLLVFRSAVADVWPWPVSDGVAQFYSGPFLTLAWCCWAYSRRDARDGRGFFAAMAVLGVAVIAVSLNHRVLFHAEDAAAWVWFAAFALLTVWFGALVFAVQAPTGVPKRTPG